VYAKFSVAEKAKHWQLRNPGKERGTGSTGGKKSGISATNVSDFASAISSAASEAAPCPLQPCYFAKWDLFADIWDCQYAMGFPVCIFMYLGVSLHIFLPIFPISRYFLMSE